MEIFDLHCDLLGYLAIKPTRTPHHPQVRCSFPQLKQGNVTSQVLAIAAETTYLSLLYGMQQLEIFQNLPQCDTHLIPAFENASAFSLENEPLQDSLDRLENILDSITPLYISLTWNGENRFGGGCGSTKGLKEDGKALLQFLAGRGIAIDFSHTSDPLANDLLNYIDAHNLSLKVLASHSNFRWVVDHPRNLPDSIAKEIIRRSGIIGLVFYRNFLGTPETLVTHIAHGLALGGADSLSFGADFFFTEDLSAVIADKVGFFPELSDASCYPSLVHSLQNAYPQEIVKKITSQNALAFNKQNTKVFTNGNRSK